MASPTSSIDLTYIYKLSIVKIKSIGCSNANNQATNIRKDTNTLRKLVLINTFIERKMAFYEELLLAKRNSANMNIGCGKVTNNVGAGGNGVRVKLANMARPNAGGNGIYSNPAATVSNSDLCDYEEDEYERPTSPPPPYSPPSSPVYQHVQKKSLPQKQPHGRPNNSYNKQNYQNYQRQQKPFQKQQRHYQQQQQQQQHYQGYNRRQQEHPSKHDFGQILIPVQVHRNVYRPVERAHYQQQYHPSQGGYYNQSRPKEPQKAVQKILIPLPASPKQNLQFANVTPPRYAPALPPSHQFHLVKLVRRPQLVDNSYY